jgi:hypothetical protein
MATTDFSTALTGTFTVASYMKTGATYANEMLDPYSGGGATASANFRFGIWIA